MLEALLDPVEMIMQRGMLQNLLHILDNNTHPLPNTVIKQSSVLSQRLLQVDCNKVQCWRSFQSTAIDPHYYFYNE